jgi:HEAT repeat protein
VDFGQWLRTVTAVAALAAAVPPADAQPATEPATPASSLSPGQELNEYLDRLTKSLNQAPQSQRDEAAQRLVEIGSFQTQTKIGDALQEGDERTQSACARAIANGRAADPRWRVPLLQLLDKDHLVDAAAHALARYDWDPSTYTPLIERARNRQQAARRSIVNALGQIVQKPVAEELLAIVSDPTEDVDTRSAAAQSLQELSGQNGFDVDAHRWQKWWNDRAAAKADDWRTQVLSEQHPMLERQQAANAAELPRFKAAIGSQLARQYDRLPPAEKLRNLLGLLKDDDANVREIGVDFVSSAINAGQPVPDEIHRQLIELVGDASQDVRDQAVNVLRNLGDRKALDALLVQLQIEPSNRVKLSLLKAIAIAGIDNAKSVAVVEQSVQDPSPVVAAGAARTLGALAGLIRANPVQSKQMFDALRKMMEDRTGAPGMPVTEPGLTELRAALVGAMARLSPDAPLESGDLFPQLLNPNESPDVRRAALQGLAALGPRSKDEIARELDPANEPDPLVREAAASALGQVGWSFDSAQELDKRIHPRYEPEASVREAARRSLQNILPAAPVQDLSAYADLYSRDKEVDRPRELELAVRQELAKKVKGQGLAVEQQRIGDIALQLTPPRYDLAVASLGKALKYWEGAQPPQPSTVARLVQELERSLLRSGQYREAVQFGGQEIARDPVNQDFIGPEILNVLQDLMDKGKNGDAAAYKAARDLINEALKMNPPLDAQRLFRLNEQKDGIPAGA